MWNTVRIFSAAALVVGLAGCAGMGSDASIMQATPGDPIGSANIGTGSVTTGAAVSPEAKAAGIGLGP